MTYYEYKQELKREENQKAERNLFKVTGLLLLAALMSVFTGCATIPDNPMLVCKMACADDSQIESFSNGRVNCRCKKTQENFAPRTYGHGPGAYGREIISSVKK